MQTPEIFTRDVGLDAWGQCTPLTIVDQFGIKIISFTSSYELGRLLKKKKKKKMMMTKIRISHMSDFSCGRFVMNLKAFLWLAKGP